MSKRLSWVDNPVMRSIKVILHFISVHLYLLPRLFEDGLSENAKLRFVSNTPHNL